MADFSKNITNAVNVFGNGPSTKWGQAFGFPYTMTWGTSRWGEGESLPISFKKVIGNDLFPLFEYARSGLRKNFDFGSFLPTQAMGSSTLRDGTGVWKYVFISDTTSQNERDFASWTAGTDPDVTFTCQAAAGTSWSEL